MRTRVIFVLLVVLSASVAYAQEGAGAGRIEVSAFPGGGVFFGTSANEAEADFGNYTVGAAFTWNFNRWVGIEGDEGLIPIFPGTTLVMPANVKHWFRATGDKPLIAYGVHVSPHRIVNVHE